MSPTPVLAIIAVLMIGVLMHGHWRKPSATRATAIANSEASPTSVQRYACGLPSPLCMVRKKNKQPNKQP